MTTRKKGSLHRNWSQAVTDGTERAASRAMLHAVGFTREDFRKSQVGVASTWSQVTPCNLHIDRLARRAAEGVAAAGAKPVIFNTITISDAVSMGTAGMRYSLVSREIIADSIEAVTACEGFDGLVAIGGCDKNMPGCLIAMARLNRPAVFVYGGTVKPGCHHGKKVDIVSVFEAVGRQARGEITGKELREIEACAIPGAGSCGGMYGQHDGVGDRGAGHEPAEQRRADAVSAAKVRDCREAGRAVTELIRRGIRPSDILVREAFLNAIATVMAMGSSIPSCTCWPSPTRRMSGWSWTSRGVGARTPMLAADLKPFGRHVMSRSGGDQRHGAADEMADRRRPDGRRAC